MDQTHLHLLITHLPIIGSILGALVLAYGIWTKTYQTQVAAYGVLIISSIGAGISYLTGEAAEETVENIQGISENMIKEHEEIALVALIALIVAGVLSIIGILLTFKNSRFFPMAATITLFISLISFGIIGWTGYLGGQIRHTEINSATPRQEQNGDDED